MQKDGARRFVEDDSTVGVARKCEQTVRAQCRDEVAIRNRIRPNVHLAMQRQSARRAFVIGRRRKQRSGAIEIDRAVETSSHME